MSPSSRRDLLHTGVAVGTLAVAGCLGITGATRETAQRQIASSTRPRGGTWPTASYDPLNTRANPAASPPRTDPTTAWSIPLSGVTSTVVVGPDYVYASSDEEIVAVAPDGTEQWRVEFGGGLSYIADRLYASADDLVALDAASDRELCRGLTRDVSPGGGVRDEWDGLCDESDEPLWVASRFGRPTLAA